MITMKELYERLAQLGIPIAYHHFNEPPASIPYICYFAEGYESEYADGINYQNYVQLRVELYNNRKDVAVEAAIEEVFRDCELPYTKDESFIDEEQIYMLIYEMEVK